VRKAYRVPLVDLVTQHRALEKELLPAVTRLIDSQQFILGEEVAAFERALADFVGTAHAVGVASGTDALVLALRALGIGPGDAVVTSAFGFVATVGAIRWVGARPLFVDMAPARGGEGDGESGFSLSVAAVEARLAAMRLRADGSLVDPASGALVRAVLPAHLFGECAPMGAMLECARVHGLAVIEDAAQAIGATEQGRVAGSFGLLGCLSFFPSKNLGGWGDGGAVVGSDDALSARVRRTRTHGEEEVGTNSRLDALQAVVLSIKLRHVLEWNVARARAAARYVELFSRIAGKVAVPRTRPGSRHVYNQFVLRAQRRDALRAHLESLGIESRPYYPRTLPQDPRFADCADGTAFPHAEAAVQTALGIPIFPEITPEQQAIVAEAVTDFYLRG
jgi:dTDP-4-amino-4,6-dideoxygalactose transaminase